MNDIDKLRQQIVTILQRNQDEDFLRMALMKVAVLEKVWYEEKQRLPKKK